MFTLTIALTKRIATHETKKKCKRKVTLVELPKNGANDGNLVAQSKRIQYERWSNKRLRMNNISR